MTNRFYTKNSTKWSRHLRISEGVSSDPKKFVTDFVFDPDAHPSVAKLGNAYEEAFGVLADARTFRAKTNANERWSPLGKTEAIAEHALIDALPRLKRARVTVDRVKAELEERRARFVPTPPNDGPHAEAQRAELRAVVRNMPAAERNHYLNLNMDNESLVAALIHADPLASGVDRSIWNHLRDRQVEIEHGEAISELADLEEVASISDDVLRKAREELFETVGIERNIFEQIASVAEANGGELPFRVDREEGPGGQPIEVAKVYDMASKQWRLASSDEIQQSTRAA